MQNTNGSVNEATEIVPGDCSKQTCIVNKVTSSVTVIGS